MNEFVNCPVWIQTVFGTLDGWWKFVDKERRTMGPTLSEEVLVGRWRGKGERTIYSGGTRGMEEGWDTEKKYKCSLTNQYQGVGYSAERRWIC